MGSEEGDSLPLKEDGCKERAWLATIVCQALGCVFIFRRGDSEFGVLG